MTTKDFTNCPIDAITKVIVDEMYQTYFMYGPGLFERIYEATLAGRLRKRGLRVERQQQVFITNEFVENEPAFFADLIVEGRVIVELKSVKQLQNVDYKQLRTYLNLLDMRVGLLVNFNCDQLKGNIRRITNKFDFQQNRISDLLDEY